LDKFWAAMGLFRWYHYAPAAAAVGIACGQVGKTAGACVGAKITLPAWLLGPVTGIPATIGGASTGAVVGGGAGFVVGAGGFMFAAYDQFRLPHLITLRRELGVAKHNHKACMNTAQSVYDACLDYVRDQYRQCLEDLLTPDWIPQDENEEGFGSSSQP